MIWRIARKEFTEITRDGRFLWTCLIMVVLLLISLAVGAWRYGEERALREAASAEVRAQWLGQGEKGPHAAAHYGVYAFKPATPLALFDPGLNDYTGTILFLEAHRENQAGYMPVQDATAVQRFGEMSGAMVLQLLIPLVIILLCFNMISGEREEGTLRLLLSAGASSSDIVWGKALGALLTLTAVLTPALAVGVATTALTVAQSEPHDLIDFPAKIVTLSAAYLMYLAVFVFISLLTSLVTKRSRTVLTVLLAFWIIGTTLLPRAASDLSRRLYPALPAMQLAAALERGRDAGPHPHEPNHPNHIAFREKVLAKYGVSRIEDLPFGFVGYALQADEEHGYKVHDQYYGELRHTYERQNNFQQFFSFVSPYMAIRSLSAALSGTDVDFFHDFSSAGEAYRRAMVKTLNHDLMRQTVGKDVYYGEWEYTSGPDLWRRIPAFDFDAPALATILKRNFVPLIALGLWLVGGAVLLMRCTRRLQIEA